MKKMKLVVTEKFVGKRDLEDVLISAFQTELSVLKNDEISVIMKSTKQSQDSFCSGKTKDRYNQYTGGVGMRIMKQKGSIVALVLILMLIHQLILL